MPTKRKPWPKTKLAQKDDLIHGAHKLYERCHLLREYGVLTHNIPYLRTELPHIKRACELHILTTKSVLKDSTRKWPRSMIADLNEVKGVLFELITMINHTNRYVQSKDYESALKYAFDFEDYAWEFYQLMETYCD